MAFLEEFAYIVVVQEDRDGVQETCLYECDPGESHRRRLDSLPFNILRCLGGGRFAVDDDEKLIELFRSSDTYGPEPDRKLSVRLMEERNKGYRVRIRQA